MSFSVNPSEYEGKLIAENRELRDHLRWCFELLENFPMEKAHEGPCSPITPCDASCMDAYYFSERLKDIEKILR